MEVIAEPVSLKKAALASNDVLKTIYSRRSVRKYNDTPVENKIIEQLLDAGRIAPSAMNKQPWKFYILTNKEQIKLFSNEIAKAAAKGILKSGMKGVIKTASAFFHFHNSMNFFKEDDPIFHGAPVVLFITSPKDNEWAALDVGMCSQNMMLAAKSLGLDSCPVGFGKYVEHTRIFSTLNIPKNEQVNLAIIFGYGNENPAPHERIRNNAVFL